MAIYTEELINIFETSLKENYKGSVTKELISRLLAAITNRKYDAQDQALIEIALNNDRENFAESVSENLKLILDKKADASVFIRSEEGQQEIIDLFLKSLEHTIDFYYNSIISKQFSST